jgi:hypothetical protein
VEPLSAVDATGSAATKRNGHGVVILVFVGLIIASFLAMRGAFVDRKETAFLDAVSAQVEGLTTTMFPGQSPRSFSGDYLLWYMGDDAEGMVNARYRRSNGGLVSVNGQANYEQIRDFVGAVASDQVGAVAIARGVKYGLLPVRISAFAGRDYSSEVTLFSTYSVEVSVFDLQSRMRIAVRAFSAGTRVEDLTLRNEWVADNHVQSAYGARFMGAALPNLDRVHSWIESLRRP